MPSPTPADRNRRVFFRLPIHLPVAYRLAGDDPGVWLQGTTVNLSAGGLLLQGPMLDDVEQDALLMGYRGLEMRLYLPSGKSLDLRGAAVWMESSDDSGRLSIGVEFEQLPSSRHQELQSFVEGCCEVRRSTVQ